MNIYTKYPFNWQHLIFKSFLQKFINYFNSKSNARNKYETLERSKEVPKRLPTTNKQTWKDN